MGKTIRTSIGAKVLLLSACVGSVSALAQSKSYVNDYKSMRDQCSRSMEMISETTITLVRTHHRITGLRAQIHAAKKDYMKDWYRSVLQTERETVAKLRGVVSLHERNTEDFCSAAATYYQISYGQGELAKPAALTSKQTCKDAYQSYKRHSSQYASKYRRDDSSNSAFREFLWTSGAKKEIAVSYCVRYFFHTQGGV